MNYYHRHGFAEPAIHCVLQIAAAFCSVGMMEWSDQERVRLAYSMFQASLRDAPGRRHTNLKTIQVSTRGINTKNRLVL